MNVAQHMRIIKLKAFTDKKTLSMNFSIIGERVEEGERNLTNVWKTVFFNEQKDADFKQKIQVSGSKRTVTELINRKSLIRSS